ncbi:hypothetical protein GA0115253_105242 [Streptomyces sp. Termitarium-T10T-6]|nr:hypothetical protein GA0115253_105242 [Streptomyces sp. Termitarium-T10T-6]
MSGRGLMLVDRLADVWGVESRGSGQVRVVRVPHPDPLKAGPLKAGPLKAGPLKAGPLKAGPGKAARA